MDRTRIYYMVVNILYANGMLIGMYSEYCQVLFYHGLNLFVLYFKMFFYVKS